jgi:SPP1 family predicted phage head-tail adaptor
MKPEKLDRRITLQRSTDTQDEYGSPVKVWNTLGPATIAANYKPVSDGEKFAAGEVGATLSARFTIRYDSAWADVSALDRLTFEGREFDIVGAKEVDGRRQFIEITAAARSETPPA